MAYITRYLTALWDLFSELWFWFLIGFLAAGVVEQFIPRTFIDRHFGKNNLSSLGKATISGLVASTCSCGAIPMAVALREKGASTAVALTFLLATPWSGIPQFLVLSSFVGVTYTALLMVTAVFSAFLSGLVLSRLEHGGRIDAPHHARAVSLEVCCDEDADDCPDCGTNAPATDGNRLAGVLRSAWCSFKDLGIYLGIGLLLAAALAAFVPTDIVSDYLGSPTSPFAILLAVPISAVIELCSEGFSVLAGQLFTMGATLGVVFVMLMVGVTTDFTEISVVWGKFGRRSAVAFVLAGTSIAIVLAYLLNFLMY